MAVKPLDGEKKWQAEDDARLLKRHEELSKDKERLTNAHKIIKEELATLSTLVGKGTKTETTAKTNTTKTKSKANNNSPLVGKKSK